MLSRTARSAGVPVGAAAGLLPGSAWAADSPDTAAWAWLGLAFALALGAVLLSIVERMRRRSLQRRLDAAEAQNKSAADLLSAAPAAAWPLSQARDARAGRDVARLLGMPREPQGLDEILSAFDAGDAETVRAACAELTARGQTFDLDGHLPDGRVIALAGRVSGAGAPALWLQDVTADRQATADRAKSLAIATESAARFGAVLDGAHVPMWRRDGKLNLVWCNRHYAEMVESTPAQVIARRTELASSMPAQAPVRLAERARDSGMVQGELRHVVVAGDRRALKVYEAPATDGGLIGWAEDVTALESAQSDLARHIGAHTEVLQNLATAIGIFGADQRLILFNRAFARLWRLDDAWLSQQPSLSELLEHLRELRRLPEQADWRAYKRQLVEMFTHVIEPREDLMHLPDERTLRVVITPHPFGGLLFTYEDVTGQLVLERARNTLIAVQRATLDNLYEGVAVFGGDGRLKLWNTPFASIWQLNPAMLAEEPHISAVIDAIRGLLDDGNDWPAAKARMMAPLSERSAQGGRIDRTDDRVVDYACVPLPDGAVLITYLDVTDTTRIERALRDRNEALQAADQLKSEFIANVSYELRTPLNTIIGFAEIIANQYFGDLNQRQLEYAEGILDSSHQLLFLVNDILDLATIEAGHMVLERELFDLHATFVAILGLTRERARRQNLTMELGCPPDIGRIDADERRIKQVLFNLMSNAMKFTPPGGTISLGARREEDEVVLWVTDTGIGISEGDQQRVFQRFYKGRGVGRQPGAGLGLSLVQSFIELHGGRVELRSAPDQGTSVTCHLPLTARGKADARATERVLAGR
ncbi:MAG TPA: PAS-domain containing protein [Candidatus Cybelea sp.]|nr:PAS-domain containing protein [Candidatus Cybelea sp.]